MKKIDEFEGNFAWMSNFSDHSFRDEDGVLWRTVEHYYQAMKTINMVDRGRIWSISTPGQAKRIGQEVALRDNWDDLKFDFMTNGVMLKFLQNKGIAELLDSTKGYSLIEGNWWHDNIWGDCNCPKCENKPGKNWLGKILMLIREGFSNE